jgi:hypothetical protein
MERRQSTLICVSLKDSNPKSKNIFEKPQEKTHVLRDFGINNRQERVSTEPLYIYWISWRTVTKHNNYLGPTVICLVLLLQPGSAIAGLGRFLKNNHEFHG